MSSIDEFYGRDLAFKSDFVLTPTGDLDTRIGLDNLKDALYRRLLTQPGTLVHRPDFGVGIKSYQNAPTTIDKKRELTLKIAEEFKKDPRVKKVTEVLISQDSVDPSIMKVVVKIDSVGYGELEAKFELFGGV